MHAQTQRACATRSRRRGSQSGAAGMLVVQRFSAAQRHPWHAVEPAAQRSARACRHSPPTPLQRRSAPCRRDAAVHPPIKTTQQPPSGRGRHQPDARRRKRAPADLALQLRRRRQPRCTRRRTPRTELGRLHARHHAISGGSPCPPRAVSLSRLRLRKRSSCAAQQPPRTPCAGRGHVDLRRLAAARRSRVSPCRSALRAARAAPPNPPSATQRLTPHRRRLHHRLAAARPRHTALISGDSASGASRRAAARLRPRRALRRARCER